MKPYPRDLIGYGANPPDPKWPGGARLAVQFVLNYEEGGENCVLNGDSGSETFLSEIIGAAKVEGARHICIESLYEYGSRAGVWRLLGGFRRRGLPVTIIGVETAMARNSRAVAGMLDDGHEIAADGWRWISYQESDEATEREHRRIEVETIERLNGAFPRGWYTGRDRPNTRRLSVEHGGFLYEADSYADRDRHGRQVEVPGPPTPIHRIPDVLGQVGKGWTSA